MEAGQDRPRTQGEESALDVADARLADWGGHVPNLLEMVPTGPDSFRGRYNQPNFQKALYGGQLLAQAVAAASATDPVGELHSLHAYFLRGGTGEVPVDFAVSRLRDSRNSASRRVTARQQGQDMFELTCLFRLPREGFSHQAQAWQDVPQPEDLESLVDIHRDDPTLLNHFGDFLLQSAPVEVRPFERDHLRHSPGPARRGYWIRLESAAAIDDDHIHRCLLAYISDYWFSRVVLVPHCAPVPERELFFASIDHAMWFYGRPRVDQWMLYQAEGPITDGDTGLAQGRIFDRSGRLIAVTTQDVILRPRPTPLAV